MEFSGEISSRTTATSRKDFPAQNCTSFVDKDTGITVNILCSSYADRHFVVITQNEKFGTFVSCYFVISFEIKSIVSYHPIISCR